MTLTTGENDLNLTLKKITFSFMAGTQEGQNDLNPESPMFDLIYGIGTDGLTPFEFEIDGKNEGDTINMTIYPEDVCKAFKHITLPVFKVPDSNTPVCLQFKIEKISEPSSREVIKAMAEQNACSGGSCECCGH